MLTAAFIFLVIAIVSGYMGYKGAGTSLTNNAKIIFYLSLIIFLMLLIIYLFSPAAPVQNEIKNPLL
ncbi:DUF1328 family protein [Legionella parisiensis]|uniref:UPF0391 membrane protein lpari_00080 n=1 Tax=Legionella parisiensis TaxID=45071 RepID=A0A1E5JWU3_9GAMM|nr:DUF1328 family protein [Legionella parisiensis]KTD42262.1 transmembrane protein [Legionella parisiensis]OEH48935.1 hypothetical protein lpari_00080 [Legionella parisiensis]STX72330.1 transmembrane protein [Legionella parisiensis]